MSDKVTILKAFLENKELYENMRLCTHNRKDGEPNPYHLEGSIWTHTMLTYNAANPNSKFELIMALCHDIGKVLTRSINSKNGRVSFYGHADASIQPTIDFLFSLFKKGIMDDMEVGVFMKYCLPAMANHMIFYQNLQKQNHFTANDYILNEYFERMAAMDSEGSICKIAKIKDNVKGLELLPYTPTVVLEDKPTVTIWTGLPGSGKDYLAEKTKNPIISWDDIRVEAYTNNMPKKVLDNMFEGEIYDRAWAYCNEHKVDLNKIMSRKARSLLTEGVDVNICNTSLTRKSRRSIINTIGTKYNYNIKQVFAPTELTKDRNNTRDSKTVPVGVINRMMNHMTVATHFEKNVNDIEYILNL